MRMFMMAVRMLVAMVVIMVVIMVAVVKQLMVEVMETLFKLVHSDFLFSVLVPGKQVAKDYILQGILLHRTHEILVCI